MKIKSWDQLRNYMKILLIVCFILVSISITNADINTESTSYSSNEFISEKMTTDLVNIVAENDNSSSYQFTHPITNSIVDNKIFVYITLKNGSDISLIKPYVSEIVSTGQNSVVTAWVSVDKLKSLSTLNVVRKIRPVSKPMLNIGSVNTEGDAIHHSDIVRSTYLQNGSGIKIGVISNGVDDLATSQATRDLPVDVTVLRNSMGGNEGIAMMEIIHDMAPGAKLYFHDYGNSVYEFNNAIDALVKAGCNIIVDDVTWPDEPFFEDGVVAKHVSQVLLKNDVLFVSSAGNSAQRHYQGSYANDGTNDHNNIFYLPAGTSYQVFMQWDDKIGSSTNDYDLYVYNKQGGKIAYSNNTQNGDDDPYEWVFTPNLMEDAYIKIRNRNGLAQARTLELYVYPSSPQTIQERNFTSADSIFGHSAVKDVITVGAVSPDSNYGTIEPYSSRGPVTIRYPNTSLIFKPDLVAVDKVSVSGAGNFGKIFSGTSASAAHVAAITAQIWGSNKTMSPLQVKQTLYNNAIREEGTMQDNTKGFGLIDALKSFSNIANRSPVLQPLQNITVNLNQPVHISLVANDPDNNPLNYSKNSSFGTLSGNIFSWIPSADAVGNHTIAFTVSDGKSRDMKTVHIRVNNQLQSPQPNAPQIIHIGNKQINENQSLNFIVSSIGATNVSYIGLNIPRGAFLNNKTGAFSWIPTYNDSGNYNLQFIAKSNNITSSENITITVNNIDRPPIFNNIRQQNITAGQRLNFRISANDPDGDIIQYTTSMLPAGANFNTTTADFVWNTNVDTIGVYYIIFNAKSNNLSAQQMVRIDVLSNSNNNSNVVASISDVLAKDITPHSITLHWINSQIVSSIELYRNGILLGNIPNSTTEYIDVGLNSNTTYHYSLVPLNINNDKGNIVNLFITTPPDNINSPQDRGSSSGSSSDSGSSSGSPSDSGSSSGSSSGSASVGNVGTNEDFNNLILTDVSSQYLWKDRNVTYTFSNSQNDINKISLFSLKNSGQITSTVEILHNKSKLVNTTPKGSIYKYVNIWLGKGGFTNESVRNITIQFRVNNSWLTQKGLDAESVKLQHYDKGKWQILPTQYLNKENGYTYFKSSVPHFSSFAMTADKSLSTINVPDKRNVDNESTTEVSSSIVPYVIIILIVLLFIVGIYMRQNKK